MNEAECSHGMTLINRCDECGVAQYERGRADMLAEVERVLDVIDDVEEPATYKALGANNVAYLVAYKIRWASEAAYERGRADMLAEIKPVLQLIRAARTEFKPARRKSWSPALALGQICAALDEYESLRRKVKP